MRLVRYVVMVAILVMGVSFALLNPGSVTVNYGTGGKTLSFSLLMVILFAMGWGMGLLMACVFLIGTRLENFRLRRRLKLAESELRNLRVMPIQDRR